MNGCMPRATFRDSALQAVFDATGFVVVPIFEADRIAMLGRAWRDMMNPLQNYPFSASVMTDDASYRDAVDALLGEAFSGPITELFDDYRFVLGNFLTKAPFSDWPIPLHQDGMFVDEARFESVSLWVPLRTVGPQSGCLRVMPGSHRINRAPRGTDRRFPYPGLMETIEKDFLCDVAMPAGSACIMSLRLVHASYANSSPYARVCASALAVPGESALCYMHQEDDAPIDVYDVDDEFLKRHVYGMPPHGSPSRRLAATADACTAADLAAAYSAATPYLARACAR
jgi:hypothetical protein